MITVSEGKKMLEEMIIRNLNEEAKKLKVRKGSVKFVYLTSVFLDPMNFEAIQFLCNEICLEDNFNKVLAELTDGMAINPKLSCWPNGHLVDINLIFMSKNLVEC